MLTDSELARLKHECGYNLLTLDASPYIGVTSFFEDIVAPNLTADGETIIREILAHIDSVKAEMASADGSGTIRAVDEISFHSTGERTAFAALTKQLTYWRTELRAAIGLASEQCAQLSSY
jgi:hypothetical protein